MMTYRLPIPLDRFGAALRAGSAGVMIVAGGTGLAIAPAFAQDAPKPAAGAELKIELNKVEQTDQGCRPVFLLANRTGHSLNRFQIDLVLFDPEGTYSQQVLLDMAPIHKDKQFLTSFLLDKIPCADIGRILVNNVPHCEDGAGTTLDCVGLLAVSSRSDIPLEK